MHEIARLCPDEAILTRSAMYIYLPTPSTTISVGKLNAASVCRPSLKPLALPPATVFTSPKIK